MPHGILVYHTNHNYSLPDSKVVRKNNTYAIILDVKRVDFKPTYSSVIKAPKAFMEDESGEVLAGLNAGFLGWFLVAY